MKFRIVRVKDKLTNEKAHNITNIISNCEIITRAVGNVAINTQKNIKNGIEKDLDISFYRETCLRDISSIRKLLDKIENDLNKIN